MAKQAGARENPIIALQRYIGNQGVQRLLQRVEDEADLDASDGHIEFPVDHVPVGGAAVGPVVNEDNIGVPNPVGPTLAGDNLAVPSFDWF